MARAGSTHVDIRGARFVLRQFAIVPALVRAQALCVIDGIRIEWHTRFWNARVAAAAAAARNLSQPHEVGAKLITSTTEAIRKQVRSMLPSTDCRTQLLEADDESYIHDRKPFPQAAICNRTLAQIAQGH
jgi:hypothetical protein